MKQKLAIVFLLSLCSFFHSFAQDSTLNKGAISGEVLDTATLQSMTGAKLVLFRYNDTVSYRTVYAQAGGTFSFSKLPIDSFWVKVYFAGYATMKQKVVLTKQFPSFPLEPFYMKMSANNLDEVVVVSTRPISFNGDTTELRADAFHTKPNATAEDLLKKLPGIEIDASGNIKAEGESVTRVLVNGKRFFGDDPKLATQNLPKDIVDKIQVYDAQSDQSTFSGFDDGNRTKTINIIIKKDKNQGYFGRMTAGGGRNDAGNLYNVGGNINRFNNDEKISLLGQINNINSQMFTAQDLGGGNGRFSGGGRGSGSSGSFGGTSSGITKTIAAGLRYANKFGKTDIDGSYFYNNTRTINDSHSEKEYLYTDTTNNTYQYDTSSTLSKSQNHRFQLNIESKIDSFNSVIIRPTMSFISSDNYSNSITDIFKNTDGTRSYVTKSNIINKTHNSGFNGSGNALYMHRFGKAGRTISAGADWTGAQNNGYGYTTNDINYVSLDSVKNVNRYYLTKYNSNSIGGTLSYTEPIAKYQQLQLEYNHTYSKSVSDRTVYNYDSTTSAYSSKDATLTNDYHNTYNSDRVTLGYHYNNSTINFSAGTGVQFGTLNSINTSKNSIVTQRYTNMYPTASFRWNIEKARRLNFDYSGRTTQPTAIQLQPVLDNSNELAQTIGNANLRQSFAHSFKARYMFFNRQNYKHLFSMLDYTVTQNSIANVVTQLTSGGTRTSYANMSGKYSLTGNMDYGFPLANNKSNLAFRTNISLSKTPSMIVTQSSSLYDTAYNTTKNYSFGERIGWTTNFDSLLDINISTEPSYTIAKYSVNKSSNSNYYSQNVTLEGTFYTTSGWIASATFNYTYYTGLYNTSVPILNVALSHQLFKDKSGEIKLSVNDLLNQNKAITNTRSDNYILTSTNTVLKRYAMLSFVYNLKKFGKKGKSDARDMDRFRGDGPPMGPPPSGGGGGMGGPPGG